MQQYFVEENKVLNNKVIIDNPDDVHHIKKVMRMKMGEKIRIVLEKKVYIAILVLLNEQSIEAEIIEQGVSDSELSVQVNIALALLKGDKIEYAIQKLTELGMYKFSPWIADRSIVKIDEKNVSKKIKRWQKIAKEAAEQSKRMLIPQIQKPMSFQKLSEELEKYDCIYLASEIDYQEAKQIAKNTNLYHNILLIIGPEGGFSSRELNFLTKKKNIEIISLGKRILRAETAAIYGMSVLSYLYDKQNHC